MPTTFWNLCNDIILEICEYFSANELFFSFYPNVLPDIFQLLTKSHINLHLSLTNDELYIGTLLSLIDVNQVISLHLSSSDIITLNMFHSVKKLTLQDVSDKDNILRQSSISPLLQYLILIYSNNITHQSENAIRNAFLRPSIKYLKLHLINDPLFTPRYSLGQSFSIEQLIVHATCSNSTIKSIIDSLPCLRILRTRTLMSEQSLQTQNQHAGINIILPPANSHPSLEIIDLVWHRPDRSSITMFLISLPRLKRCRLSGVMNPKELDGKYWYNLLTKTCPNLRRMIINMILWSGRDAKEIMKNFDEDQHFKDINFKLKLSDKENELLILIGDFKRSVF